ncbi:MAG: hypothetical protein FJ387_05020 [Verrucomicrobia bacterium]|nr:hypothetical protein [Verrucomicrobiota bacterium]
MRAALPPGGLFAEQAWRIGLGPFPLGEELAAELESLGRALLQFNRAVNLLYRLSVAGRQPGWVAEWLDRGKPPELIELERHQTFKHELPRVIRPDILLTEDGWSITELDAVPGGIGLTAWLNRAYAQNAGPGMRRAEVVDLGEPVGGGGPLGGDAGMLDGFAAIFGEAPRVHIVVSEEARAYRPEMLWLAEQLGPRFHVRTANFAGFADGDAVYRFFELFDLANVPCAAPLFAGAVARRWRLTPPPKPVFEEKLLLALLWNRNLQSFWRQELGAAFFRRLLEHVPYTWVVDPAPLPPQASIPELGLTDWQQLKTLSQRERNLILKVSGFADSAWGARSVALGSDLSAGDWSAAVDAALAGSARNPWVLQRYHRPRVVTSAWYDFARDQAVAMTARVRLCPYYFVVGDGDAARARLGGVLATLCPADKKIIHGMRDAILVPCQV